MCLRVLRHRLSKWTKGRSSLALVAAAPEHTRALHPSVGGKLLERARFPNPRLAHQHDECASARAGTLEPASKARHLLVPADEGRLHQEASPGLGRVQHLAHADLLRNALEIQGPKLPEVKGLAPCKKARHRGAAEDLPCGGRVAKPLRQDHRRPEVAAADVLVESLSGIQAHTDREAVAADCALACLLHGGVSRSQSGTSPRRAHGSEIAKLHSCSSRSPCRTPVCFSFPITASRSKPRPTARAPSSPRPSGTSTRRMHSTPARSHSKKASVRPSLPHARAIGGRERWPSGGSKA